MRNLMRFLQNVPIKRKLTLLTMLTSGVALLLACIAFVAYDQVTFRRAIAAELFMLTDLLDDNLAPGLTFGDSKSLEVTLNALNANPHILAAVVYDSAGKPVASYQRADLKAPFVASMARATGTRFEGGQVEAFRQIVLAGEVAGTIYIASDLRELTTRLWRYGLIVSLVLVLSSLAAFVLAAKLQRIISDPISHLAKVAHAVAVEKDYSVRALKHGEDELGRLIEGFNEMLNQIQTRDGALQEAQGTLEKRVVQRTEELQQKQSELRVLFDLMPAMVWFKDTNDRILRINQRVADTAGKAFDEIEGRPSVENYPHEAARHYADDLEVIHSGKPKLGIIETIRDRKGGEIWIQTDKVPVRGNDGMVTGIVVMAQDITERKLAEEKLRASERLLQSTLDALSAHIAILDESGVIIAVNAVWKKFADQNDFVGEEFGVGFNYIAVCDSAAGDCAKEAAEVAAGIRGVMANQHGEFVLEYPCHSPNEQRWFSVRVTRFAGSGPIRIVVAHENITQRRLADQSLEEAHKQLLDTSRQAGMAEVATSVLHNVGNVLNSVNVSATLLAEQAGKSKVRNLAKVVALMEENAADLGAFISLDPKGRQIPGYLAQLSTHLSAEQTTFLRESDQLRKNIEHIKDIVAMQQNYARVSGIRETLKIPELVEDALRMNAGALSRHEVEVIRDYAEIPPVAIDKHKVLQVLVNLIRNAKYACDESGRSDKRMTVRVANGDGQIKISIIDNGVGIPAENLIRIFNHGFTTRKEGHGFGLHSGALAAKELGGTLSVQSEGLGKGATFTLELPKEQPSTAKGNAV